MSSLWLLKPGNASVLIILLMMLQTSLCSFEDSVEAAKGSEYVANHGFYGISGFGLSATVKLTGEAI